MASLRESARTAATDSVDGGSGWVLSVCARDGFGQCRTGFARGSLPAVRHY